jgi:hypothetical protein
MTQSGHLISDAQIRILLLFYGAVMLLHLSTRAAY